MPPFLKKLVWKKNCAKYFQEVQKYEYVNDAEKDHIYFSTYGMVMMVAHVF